MRLVSQWDELISLVTPAGEDYCKHIRNIFEERELCPEAPVAECATTGADGKICRAEYFNVDWLVSVG